MRVVLTGRADDENPAQLLELGTDGGLGSLLVDWGLRMLHTINWGL